MKKTIYNWPIRFTQLSDAEIRDHTLLCVVAYYGGYCGWQRAFLPK